MYSNGQSANFHSVVYSRAHPYIHYIVIAIVLVVSWLPTGLSAAAAAATVQDFDVPGVGTPWVSVQTNNPPGPTVLPIGPKGVGKFLRLASALPDPNPPSSNTITFPSTAPASQMIQADFDFRMIPGHTVVPDTGRADGIGFALLNKAFFNSPGVEPQGPVSATEEPNFAGSFGIGLDIYKNTGFPGGFPNDLGNVNILPAFSNSLSIHFDGKLIKQVDVTRLGDLAEGQWIHARILLRLGGGSPNVTVILTPQNCPPVTVVNQLLIPGLAPYEARVHFGARSGGETAHHDIDNIRVEFLKFTQSVLSLSSVSYQAAESNASAIITVTRTGNIQSAVQVNYATADASAKAGSDYGSVSGTLTFAAGVVKKQFAVPILHTPGVETDELFQVILKQPGGAFVGGPAKAVVRIADTESAKASGRWDPPMCLPIVAIDMSLLPTGRVLLWDRLGNVRLWNPANRTSSIPALPGDNLFCSGHAFLGDGQLLVAGGHHHGGASIDDGVGIPDANTYNSFTNTWTALPMMNDGRWYPTVTTLGNGQLLVISGTMDEFFTRNLLPQVWRPATAQWRNLTGAANQAENEAAHGVDLYPRMLLAPDGRVFKAGPDQDTWFLNTAGTGQWSPGPSSNFGLRGYGTAVMYEPGKILIVGGGDFDGVGPDPTPTAEVIDLNAPNPSWQNVDSMQFARRHLNATVLPDGTVLVTGGFGAPGFNNEANPVMQAELWDPVSETWTTLPAMQVRRGYHSTALLLPDGRVLVAGGGQGANATGNHNNAELYSPAYLFKGARPRIDAAPTAIAYGQTFTVSTSNAASIGKVSLIRLGSVTHAFDENQRFVPLNFSPAGNGLSVTAPANGNIAPPGHYMLFIVNNNGVPSMAKIIRIG
jgi:hypothetical protein